MDDLLAAKAARSPGKAILRDSFGEVTFAELDRLATASAISLRELEVRRGDRVLVRAASSRVTVALLFGCLRTGAVFVPFHPETTRHQLTHLVADAEPALVLTDGVSPPAEATVPCRSIKEFLATLTRTVATERPVEPGPDDIALLLYTSGSTAQPKAVVCTHAQVRFAAEAVAERIRYRADDVVYCRLPLSFDYGLYQVFLTVMAGGTLVLADASRDALLLRELIDHRASVVPIVPSLASMLLTLARGRTVHDSRVRLFTNTGEHLSEVTAAALRRAFPRSGVQMMFGTTECKRISVHEVDGDLTRPGSVGRALPGTQVRILDDNGEELPASEIGEISVRGPHLMAGYWKAPELTAQRYRFASASGERFLLTGDFGWVDADGYLYFTGRQDHIFKQRGTRVSTVEIETAALRLPSVHHAAVLPPADGRDAMLCVVADIPAEDVLRGLRDLVGPTQMPTICRVLEYLPLTVNGKVDRRRLLELVAGQAA